MDHINSNYSQPVFSSGEPLQSASSQSLNFLPAIRISNISEYSTNALEKLKGNSNPDASLVAKYALKSLKDHMSLSENHVAGNQDARYGHSFKSRDGRRGAVLISVRHNAEFPEKMDIVALGIKWENGENPMFGLPTPQERAAARLAASTSSQYLSQASSSRSYMDPAARDQFAYTSPQAYLDSGLPINTGYALPQQGYSPGQPLAGSSSSTVASKEELKRIASEVYNNNFRLYHGTSVEYKEKIQNSGMDTRRKKEGATDLIKTKTSRAELMKKSDILKGLYTDYKRFNYATTRAGIAKRYANAHVDPALVRLAVPDSVPLERDPHASQNEEAWRMGNVDKDYIFPSKKEGANRNPSYLHDLWQSRLNQHIRTNGYASIEKKSSDAIFSELQSDSEDDR